MWLQTLQEGQKIAKWEHEPQTFWFLHIKRGTRSYLPDFKVTELDGSHYWIEVKGYMDSKSATKIKRFRKYYPEERLFILDKKFFLKYKKIFADVGCNLKIYMYNGEYGYDAKKSDERK